jgi:hypothetical protein
MNLQVRWTAQALYTMWQNGVSLVTWFLIRDRPPSERWQSGLYFAGSSIGDDSPKATRQAFRFPMVAFPEAGKIRVWCRTPSGAPGDVVFEQSTDGGSSYSPLPGGTLTSDANGIATALLDGNSPQGDVRARLVATGEISIPFSLTDVPDQPVNPFGN